MSDNVRLSDMLRKPRDAGRVVLVRWLDGRQKRNPGVGIFAGSLDSLRAGSVDRRTQTPGNG